MELLSKARQKHAKYLSGSTEMSLRGSSATLRDKGSSGAEPSPGRGLLRAVEKGALPASPEASCLGPRKAEGLGSFLWAAVQP